jgi:hypothetical protein
VQLMPVPAGIGVAEGAQVVALSLAHVPAAQALVVALVLRAIDLSMLLPAGLAYAADAWHLRKPEPRLTRRFRNPRRDCSSRPTCCRGRDPARWH